MLKSSRSSSDGGGERDPGSFRDSPNKAREVEVDVSITGSKAQSLRPSWLWTFIDLLEVRGRRRNFKTEVLWQVPSCAPLKVSASPKINPDIMGCRDVRDSEHRSLKWRQKFAFEQQRKQLEAGFRWSFIIQVLTKAIKYGEDINKQEQSAKSGTMGNAIWGELGRLFVAVAVVRWDMNHSPHEIHSASMGFTETCASQYAQGQTGLLSCFWKRVLRWLHAYLLLWL